MWTFRICASITALAGLFLIVAGFWASEARLDAGLNASLIGISLLASGAICNLVLPRRWKRQAAPATSCSILDRATQREDREDAHWRSVDTEVRYRQLLDSQHDFIVHRAPDDRIVFANSAFVSAFGLDPDEAIGSLFRPQALRAEPTINTSCAGRRTLELVLTRKGKRWIAWDETEIETASGGIEIQSVGRDVTIEREIEEKLREARDRAETASREKSRFLAAMSHEIRNPMNGIIGMISLLRDTPLDSEQRNYTRVVEDSARALMGLLDGILDFSKIEAGKLELAESVFSLKSSVDQMMQLMTPDAAAKKLAFTSSITDRVPDWVQGDEMRLRQIILNLLSNAIKFTDKGSVSIRIDVAEDKPVELGAVRIAIEVSDSGIGLSSAASRRLFEEFEQDTNVICRRRGGTGLGLAISKRIAQAMSGEIVASAGPDQGTVFTAFVELRTALPPDNAATGSMPDAGLAEPGLWRTARPQFRVLVVEDNPINALLACKVIERAGGNATVVEDGRSAITIIWETLERKRPAFDLILMDIVLPEIDGLMATKSIKALHKERRDLGLSCPPIIALTANAFAEDRECCLAAGMDDYLAKPFDARDLHNVLLRWTMPHARIAPPAA